MLVAALVVLFGARAVHAGCNLIPQAEPAFRGALGTVDRPYATPGDFIDVNVRQALCDQASPGVGGVTIALSDGDSPVIAREALGALAPVGKAPFKKWGYKSARKTGVVQVQLKAAGPSQHGSFKLSVKATR